MLKISSKTRVLPNRIFYLSSSCRICTCPFLFKGTIICPYKGQTNLDYLLVVKGPLCNTMQLKMCIVHINVCLCVCVRCECRQISVTCFSRKICCSLFFVWKFWIDPKVLKSNIFNNNIYLLVHKKDAL